MKINYILLPLLLVVIIGIVVVAIKELEVLDKKGVEFGGENQIDDQSDGPALIKNIGINFDDFEFTNKRLTFDTLFMDYGFVIPANSMGPQKINPQPTFILPLGTKVFSLVDGIVVGVPKLYSGDFSVMVAKSKEDEWIFETEHVINPIVKVGDIVRAGQVVAEVSDFDAHNYGGFGMVEIGILQGGEVPKHVCPFAYLDPSIKEEVEENILEFYMEWEEFKNDNSIFDETTLVSPGCLTYDAIEG